MTEKQIERRVCGYAVARGCYVRKFKAPGNRGVPDRLFITPGGVVFFIEFKRPGNTPTGLQMVELLRITHKGIAAAWVDSIKAGCEFIDEQLAK